MIIMKAHPRFEKMLKKYDEMNGRIQENLIGIRVVKAFAREDYEKKRFKESTDKCKKSSGHSLKSLW